MLEFYKSFKDIDRKIEEREIKKEEDKVTNEIEDINIEKTEITQVELAEKSDEVQEFSIDRFEENIAVLENRETGEIINVDADELPEEAKEGDILKYINGKYILDKIKTEEEDESIKNLMESLWD